jgi:hypothetical protein
MPASPPFNPIILEIQSLQSVPLLLPNALSIKSILEMQGKLYLGLVAGFCRYSPDDGLISNFDIISIAYDIFSNSHAFNRGMKIFIFK